MFKRLSEAGKGHENLLFALIQGLYWAANCMLYGFWVAYMQETGFSYTLIGLTTTLLAATGIAVQSVAGYLVDTFISSKKFLLLGVLISVPLVALLPLVSKNHVLGVCLIVTITVFQCALGGIIDSWSVKLRETRMYINYPLTRSAGSAGYGLAALVLGWLIAKLGYNVMFTGHMILLMLVALVASLAEDIPCSNRRAKTEETESSSIGFGAAIKMLLKNTPYMVFLISAIFYNVGVRVTITFVPTIITLKGGDAAYLGFALFVAAFFEFPIVLTFITLSKRIKLQKIFLLAMVFGAIRVFGIYLSPNVNVMMIFQLFQALSFGLYIPLFIEYINRIVPRQINATAITVAQAVATGLGSVAGNFIGGIVMEDYGVNTFIVINTMCILAAILIFSVSFFLKKKPKRPEF